ncbi:MAG: peptidylprolyl isomerase [Ignavibacteriaceae bacterium]|nr:peptidylprolyl isomerase [Ignavibacteriaceae bacterium]
MKPNQVVTINYILTDSEGEIIDSTSEGKSFSFLSGSEQVLPKLEEAVGAMLIGSKRIVALTAEDAYGEYIDDAVQILQRSEFPKEVEIKEGMEFVTNAPDGSQMPFVISKITDEQITVDFNHPLAGVDLTFDVELLDLRDATAEELSHGHAHGAHSHHHH